VIKAEREQALQEEILGPIIDINEDKPRQKATNQHVFHDPNDPAIC